LAQERGGKAVVMAAGAQADAEYGFHGGWSDETLEDMHCSPDKPLPV
jgi:hypothetical protein